MKETRILTFLNGKQIMQESGYLNGLKAWRDVKIVQRPRVIDREEWIGHSKIESVLKPAKP